MSFGGFTLAELHERLEAGRLRPALRQLGVITVPAVLLTLFLASLRGVRAWRGSRFRFNLTLLGLFTAANLLPPQALLIPLYRMFRAIPLPWSSATPGTLLNSYWGLILVNIAFQTGFCTFVLSNYMKTLPQELYESAEVDGAACCGSSGSSPCRCAGRPLAALATLQVTWIYNEFFWATVLLQTGDKFPITAR